MSLYQHDSPTFVVTISDANFPPFDRTVKKLREELMLALVEATSDGENGKGGIESSTSLPSSFNDLVKDMTSSGQDIKAFAFKTKAMVTSNLLLPAFHFTFSSLFLNVISSYF